MSRAALVFLPALLASACGQANDDRPRTLEYITRAVLQPTCGSAPCHSSFAQDGRRPAMPGDAVTPLVFDTLEGARASLKRDELLLDHFQPGDNDQTPTLIKNLTTDVEIAPRMPYDAPLPDEDVQLIYDWILLGGPGACSDADMARGAVCHGSKQFACTEDRAYGAQLAAGCH